MKTIRTTLVGFIFLLFPFISFSQEWEHPYFSYTKENGLPSNLVYGSLIDKDGLLWICTDGGVVMFDGGNSRIYTTEDGLPSNDVYHMFCDSKNRIWFTTLKSEVSYYYNGKIHNSRNDEILSKIKTTATFPRYLETKDQSLWMNFTPFALYRLKDNSVKKLLFPFDDKTSFKVLSYNDSELVFFSPHSNVNFNYQSNLFSTNEKLYPNYSYGLIIDSNNYWTIDSIGAIKRINSSRSNLGIPLTTRLDYLVQGVTNFYVFRDLGYSAYDKESLKLNRFDLPKYSISSIHESDSNILWISAFNDGLFKSNLRHRIKSYNGNSITSIYSDNRFMYCGTRKGEVLVLERNGGRQVDYFPNTFHTFNNQAIRKIIYSDGKVHSASSAGITNIDLKTHKVSLSIIPRKLPLSIKNVFEDRNQMILLTHAGVYFHLLHSLNVLTDTFLNNKRAYSYCRYRGRRMVGTQDSLMVIDQSYHPFPLLNPFTARIMDLQSDDSLLYAVTADNGLYIIRDYQVIHNINTASGLSSNNCYKVRLYKGHIYVATDNGISVIDRRDFSVQHIYESDGLPSGTVNDILIDKDTLYAATEAGLSMIPLKEINLDKQYCLIAKPFAVASDTTWEIPFKIVGHSTDKLSMVFHALTYIKNTKKTYYYRLSGLDHSFSLTLDKVFSFQVKRPGKYMFEAYSLNAENSPSYVLRFPITIAPLFYETVWFRAALIMLVGALTYFFYEWFDSRVRGKKNQESFRDNRVLNLEFTAWKSSVNPHFLFNSLNTMQSFYQGEDIEKASTYLNSFSGMLRKTVNLSDRLFVELDEEVEYLTSYLEFEKVKCKNTFDFNIDYSSKDVGMFHIPTLVVQPVIENSIKHAFKIGKRGFIEVLFTKKDGKLICTIRDNGPGLSDSHVNYAKSKGIQLIRSKLEICETVVKGNFTFTFSNRTSENGRDIIGFETVFIFPVLLRHYDQNTTHR